ncbi:MAG: hypothetical protein ACREUZ_05285 [Burkholderiales bacterium]
MSLKPLPTKPFRVADQMTWDANTAIVDAWNLPTRALGELDLNRNGAIIPSPADHAAFKGRQDVLDRFHVGFQWQNDDAGTTHWIPQGLTGDADSTDTEDGRNWLAASWHNEDDAVEKGMRISFVDVTAWSDPIRYRNVLLVNPLDAAQNPSNHVSFAAIAAHAGGAVWFRDYLYVADSRGFADGRAGGVLVFDMKRMKEVDDSRDDVIGWSPSDGKYYAFGYRYVLPQVGRYVQVGAAAGDRLRWSFLGLDRTGSERSLMMGEYATSNDASPRLIWWALDAASGRLAVGPDATLGASLARLCTGERFLQGCHSEGALADGSVWLARTSDDDALYERTVAGGTGATHMPWAEQPEGLTYSPASDNLWCVTERPGARAVFAVKRASL